MFNPAAEEMFRHRASDLIGQPLDILIPQTFRTAHREHVERFGRTGETNRRMGTLGALSGRRSDGEEFPVEASISKYEVGAERFYTVIVRDITQRRKAEAELQQLNQELEIRVRERTAKLEEANRELEAFAYSVSHDLRAPLRGIDGLARVLEQDYRHRLDSRGQEYLSNVVSEAARMGQLIDDLLELSRVAKVPLRMGTVDITALAWSVAADLGKREPLRKVDWQIADGLRAWGDDRLLRQVMVNLLGNAWKFTSRRDHAVIQVLAVAGAEVPTFSVRDNGVGFDIAYVEKLFQPFQRLHLNSEYPGTGVGLATVRRVVERHGGKVWADGLTDRGASFFFSLPAPQNPAPARESAGV
jgi:PAS domain S-box-containing protein